jgi:protein-S-isoprenylcysteine O-methyltransferase Ste14
MKRDIFTTLLLTILAIVITVALTFVSIELPEMTDNLIHGNLNFVNVYTGGGDLQEIKTELFIRHFHLRTIGYISLSIVIILIIAGFLTEKTGLTSIGAFAIFLPVFGHFAATMFFLGGLGFLRILWLPGLDVSFDLMKLGDAVFIPYRIILDIFNFVGINLDYLLSYIFIISGLLIFALGTLKWFEIYFKKTGLITSGLYKVSRHPQYLGWILWTYGILFLPGVNMKQSYSISDSLPWLISTLIIIGVAMVEEIKMSRIHESEFNDYRNRSYFMMPFPKYFRKVISSPFRFFFNKNYPTRKREILAVLGFYFILIIGITLILNSTAKMTAPGKWVFEEKDDRSLEELSKNFVETVERRERYRIMETMVDRGNKAIQYFIELYDNPDPVIREFSVDALGILKSDSSMTVIIRALKDTNRKVVFSALRSIGNYKSEKAVTKLVKLLNRENTELKPLIAGALVRIGTENAISPVIPLAEEGIVKPNIDLIMAISKNPSERSEDLILKYIEDEDINILRTAVIASRSYSSNEIRKKLKSLQEHDDWEVRLYADEVLDIIRKNTT